ncbi:MAG: hypothetical protein ACR2HP_13235 [Ilumatobacteraceae bacterium]
MADQRSVVTAAQFDAMSPQERADAVESGVIRSWDEVDPSFRRRVEARANELVLRSQQDA